MKAFRVIPAIDLFDGKVVRLYQGDYTKVTVYSRDPCGQAQEFLAAGAKFLHIVDLNAARSGRSKENTTAISAIAKGLGEHLELELGGGIRNWENLEKSFDLGIKRCVIGTAAVKDPDFLQKALEHYGAEKILVGVDVCDKGLVRVSGWEEASSLKASELLQNLEQMGLEEIIFTDISRDGTLAGPGDTLKLEAYLRSTKLNFILAGGLSSLKDLETILAARHPSLIGAISGRALYEKKLDLRAALEMCKTVVQ